MNALYAETSAILRWLLNDDGGESAKRQIDSHDVVVSCVLTTTEVLRVMVRARKQKLLTEAEARKALGGYQTASRGWTLLDITESLRARAAAEFPVEPVRVLDALHLASALELLGVYPDLEVLSFDKRILDNLEPLGLATAATS